MSRFHLTDIRHGTPAWHKRRKASITCTDLPAILGHAKWRSPLDIWSKIILETPIEAKESAFMDWGNALEPIAAAQFEKVTGMPVTRNDRLAVHPRLPFFVGTPDGFFEDSLSGTMSVLEIKAPSHFTRDQWAEGVAPDYYVAQVEGQLLITGLSRGCLCAILPPMRNDDELIVTTTITMSEERRAYLETTLEEWHHRHIILEEQPDAIGRDEAYLRGLHPEDEPSTYLIEGRLEDAMRRREERLADEKSAKADADDLKALLLQHMKSNAWAATEDREIVYAWRTNKAGKRVLRRIPELPKAAPRPEPAPAL